MRAWCVFDDGGIEYTEEITFYKRVDNYPVAILFTTQSGRTYMYKQSILEHPIPLAGTVQPIKRMEDCFYKYRKHCYPPFSSYIDSDWVEVRNIKSINFQCST